MMPAMATANPANFDATANSGYGGYTIDTETTLMVIEATGQRSFSSGQWVLCRPQGTANSGAWEPVAAGVGLGSATLAATLAYNDAVASVTLLGASTAVNAANLFCEAGSSGTKCILCPNVAAASPSDAPWILLRLVPTQVALTSAVGFDSTAGAFTQQQVFIQAGGVSATGTASPIGTPTPYASIGTASSDLQRDDTTTALTAPTPSPAVWGQAVTLSATVSNSVGSNAPTGAVQFFCDGNLLQLLGGALTAAVGSGGVATATCTTLPVGSGLSITAYYLGDSNYNGSLSAADTSLTVNQAGTSVALGAAPTPTNYGSAVTMTATVSVTSPGVGVPTGTITFKNGTTVLAIYALPSSGVYAYTFSGLPAGTLTLSAVYSGDTYFAASTGTASVTINKLNLTITANNAGGPHGAIPALTGTMTGMLAGDGIVPTYTTTATAASPAGSYTITAGYSDPLGKIANYNATENNGTLTLT